VARRTDEFELGRLGLSTGEARRLELHVAVDPLEFGGQRYEAEAGEAPVVLDLDRTLQGYALRMRFRARLQGPCMRCLENADRTIKVDAREIDQPGEDEELNSPYVSGDELDLRAWAREALVLALPPKIVCREDCLGLCAECGQNLNEDPEHAHERAPDPRWAKLGELRLE